MHFNNLDSVGESTNFFEFLLTVYTVTHESYVDLNSLVLSLKCCVYHKEFYKMYGVSCALNG